MLKMMFESAKIMYNANSTFELDFLANLAIYLDYEVIVNDKYDYKTLFGTWKNLFSIIL